jgi:hypothetical protein
VRRLFESLMRRGRRGRQETSWRNRPEPGTEPEMPKWMAGIDAFAPGKALGLGLQWVCSLGTLQVLC